MFYLVVAAVVGVPALVVNPCLAAPKDKEPGLGVYEVIVKKDLFDPLRGEGVQDKADEKARRYASEQELMKRYEVYGTSIAAGRRLAFIKSLAQQPPVPPAPIMYGGPPRPPVNPAQPDRPRSVKIGDSIDGWRITGIEPSGIDLELNGRHVHLAVFGPEKTERKATAPVALQTPQLKPEPIPTAQAGEAPGGAQQKAGEEVGQPPPANPAGNPQTGGRQPAMPPQIVNSPPPPSLQPAPQPVRPSMPAAGSSLRSLLLNPNH
ncbi:MAG: hypothetical protein M0022_00765 [Desulfobacteraceae bacterium]|nr:hypothetical protein [Desulfobacteraceae bacterium]